MFYVAQSSFEVEHIAADEATKELEWLSQFLDELRVDYQCPVLHVDNSASIHMKNEVKSAA